MYKLTYESDEEVAVPGDDKRSSTGDRANNEEKDNPLSSNPPSHSQRSPYSGYKSPNLSETKERRSSAEMAAFGVNREKLKVGKQKFYKGRVSSLIGNNYTQDSALQLQHCGFISGGTIFLLVLYLFALTVGVVMLFVLLQNMQEENETLLHRLNELEETTRATFSSKTPSSISVDNLISETSAVVEKQISTIHPVLRENFKDNFEDRTNISKPSTRRGVVVDSCCIAIDNRLALLRIQTLRDHGKVYEMQIRDDKQDSQIASQSTRISAKMKQFSTLLSDSIKVQKTTQSDILELKRQVGRVNNLFLDGFHRTSFSSNDESDDYKSRVVAFDAFGARSEEETNSQAEISSASFKIISCQEQEDCKISYKHETINNERDINRRKGIFIAPYHGLYFLFVSICTVPNYQNTTKVSLMRNNLQMRSFHFPSALKQFQEVQNVTLSNPFASGSISSGEFIQSTYPVILQLSALDEIYLKLTDGYIIELRDSIEMQLQTCTRFLGFRIH